MHHQLHRSLAVAYQSHAVMDSTRTQPALGNLKPSTLTQQQVLRRYSHIIKVDFGVTSYKREFIPVYELSSPCDY